MPELRLQKTRAAYQKPSMAVRFVKAWDIQPDQQVTRIDRYWRGADLIERVNYGGQVSEKVVYTEPPDV